MTTEQVEEIIQFLTKYGLNDSHILHNKDIIAKDFVDRRNELVKNDLLHSVVGQSEQFKPFKESKGMCKKCLRHWCICEK